MLVLVLVLCHCHGASDLKHCILNLSPIPTSVGYLLRQIRRFIYCRVVGNAELDIALLSQHTTIG